MVWDSGEVLARLMFSRTFSGERILEIGCGIGLASLVLSMREQNISAADQHPEASQFLRYNTGLNELPTIPFERCSWEQSASPLGRFDLIIGSDLLYERSNLRALTSFIDRHAHECCEVLIVDPNRGLRAPFSRMMEGAGFTTRDYEMVVDPARPEYKGSILTYDRGTLS